jgi:myo-inositol 2-dehydrogenase/D-chiro-inositol 1-dehydrogenase
VREGLTPEVTLEDGLRSIATGIAAHQSIASGQPVAMADVLPAGW